ncbi:MAG TPA: hypothetical protein ENN85_09115 [Methanoculleus sp.]|nr:hypothetical protein [Methanoculleus sp.]
MILCYDTFTNGCFDTGEAESVADWYIYQQGSFRARDPQSRLSVRKNRLAVDIPRFSLASTGYHDHMKFMVFRNCRNEDTGYPGFKAPDGAALRCDVRARFTMKGTAANPYHAPEDDFRLSSGVLLSTDFETNTSFGFVIAGSKVYALYERRIGGLPQDASLSMFCYVKPVREIEAGSEHLYSMLYHKQQTTATWMIDDEPVFVTPRFGKRLPKEDEPYCVVHAPTAQVTTPESDLVASNQRIFGAGVYTFMDAATRDARKLVDVDNANVPASKKVFGQGGELIFGDFTVSIE